MRHLSVVPDLDDGATVPEPAAAPSVEPPVPSADLPALFTAVDGLIVGLDRHERLAAARSFYFDADGNPRGRDR